VAELVAQCLEALVGIAVGRRQRARGGDIGVVVGAGQRGGIGCIHLPLGGGVGRGDAIGEVADLRAVGAGQRQAGFVGAVVGNACAPRGRGGVDRRVRRRRRRRQVVDGVLQPAQALVDRGQRR